MQIFLASLTKTQLLFLFGSLWFQTQNCLIPVHFIIHALHAKIFLLCYGLLHAHQFAIEGALLWVGLLLLIQQLEKLLSEENWKKCFPQLINILYIIFTFCTHIILIFHFACSCFTFVAAAIDGGFSDWTNYTECSDTCGAGVKSRERACNNPLPQNGGADCVGEMTETVKCILRPCPGKTFPNIIRGVFRTQSNM